MQPSHLLHVATTWRELMLQVDEAPYQHDTWGPTTQVSINIISTNAVPKPNVLKHDR